MHAREYNFSNDERIRNFIENLLEGNVLERTNTQNDIHNAATAIINSIVDSDIPESENDDTDTDNDVDNDGDNDTDNDVDNDVDNDINNGFIYNDSDSSDNNE